MLEAGAEPGLSFAGFLRQLRTEAGLTQEELVKTRQPSADGWQVVVPGSAAR
jgi:hypothetical protein